MQAMGGRMYPLSVTTVVVGYDGSPAADRALRRAAQAVDGDGGRAVLVTASPALMSEGVTSEPVLDTPTADERDTILLRGRELLGRFGVDAHVVTSDDEPASAIADAATAEAAQLIVVGATGAGYVARAILGGTAAAVVRLAPC